MIYFFGEVESASGIAANQAHLYNADDVVAGNILFKNGVMFNGAWRFTIGENNEKDLCEITAPEGKLVLLFLITRPYFLQKVHTRKPLHLKN